MSEPVYVAIITPVIRLCAGALEDDGTPSGTGANGKARAGLCAASVLAGGTLVTIASAAGVATRSLKTLSAGEF